MEAGAAVVTMNLKSQTLKGVAWIVGSAATLLVSGYYLYVHIFMCLVGLLMALPAAIFSIFTKQETNFLDKFCDVSLIYFAALFVCSCIGFVHGVVSVVASKKGMELKKSRLITAGVSVVVVLGLFLVVLPAGVSLVLTGSI